VQEKLKFQRSSESEYETFPGKVTILIWTQYNIKQFYSILALMLINIKTKHRERYNISVIRTMPESDRMVMIVYQNHVDIQKYASICK
jgi:hypothetical protein